jgi:SNF2 family DNA or RNA helicase
VSTVIALDLVAPGIISLAVEGRKFNQITRELGMREDYYGAHWGQKSQKFYFSFHAYTKITKYLKGVGDPDFSLSKELDSAIKPYIARQELIGAMREGKAVPQLNIQNLKLPLYPYQVVGARWLRYVERGLLADEMGLGKTPQFLSAAVQLADEEHIERILIIAPATLKYQWADEIDKFVPDQYADYIVVDGEPAERRHQWGSRLITIANYEQVRCDIATIKSIKWDLVGLDEAQRIKTTGKFVQDKKGNTVIQGCQTSALVKSIKAKYRFALTGTPIENSIKDLFNILEYIDPTIFGNLLKFKKKYMSENPWGGQQGTTKAEELRIKLNPVTFRREKRDVMPDLPPVTRNQVLCPLLPAQKDMYDQIEMESLQALEMLTTLRGRDYYQTKFAVITKMIYLREIVDSPELMDDTIKGSGKINELLDAIAENPGKFLVFTQFERMTPILKRDIEARFGDKVEVMIISGKVTSKNARNEIKKRFNSIPKQAVLLLTDAGKYGLNLQAARWVVDYDLPYNPATVAQRIGRTDRDGWKETERLGVENISVIDLICHNTIEDRVLKILKTKKKIFDEIMGDEQILQTFSEDELKYILTGDESHLK